jgi:hypothetical protein
LTYRRVWLIWVCRKISMMVGAQRSGEKTLEGTSRPGRIGGEGVCPARPAREHVVPYRVMGADKVVLPIEGANTLMDGEHDHLDRYPDLAKWWRDAERLWDDNRSSERLSLIEQLNFRKKLTDQLPGAPLRVVYAKAAMYVTAALVDDPNAIIDHKLYWGTVATREEGMYLLAVLNSAYTTEAGSYPSRTSIRLTPSTHESLRLVRPSISGSRS